jgi:hypothetical protein
VTQSTLQRLLAIASAVEPMVGIAAGGITTVAGMIAALHKVAEDLTTAPVDPATGEPLTLAQAAAHLATAEATSKTQDDLIRENAAKFRDV